MAALYPELPDDQIFTEMLFLVDRSGSMRYEQQFFSCHFTYFQF